MNNIKIYFIKITLFLCLYTEGVAQVAINTDGTTADPKAMLDIKSNDKGLLIPRMNSTERGNIAGLTLAQKGLLVYDTQTSSIWQFNGTVWVEIVSAAPTDWTTKNATTIYTDKQQVGINNNDPLAALHVNGQVAVNTDASVPSTKAQLDVKSTTKGVHIPRMSTTDRLAIAPTITDAGLMVFDLDRNRIYMFDGQHWLPFTTTNIAESPLTSRLAGDGAANDNFGRSVAISGDYAIIGAYTNDMNRGAAYIFYRDGSAWTQQAKLVAADGVANDYFGASVSISGSYAVVGAMNDDAGMGSAYVFKRTSTTWAQEAKLIASDRAINDYFGWSVSIANDVVIVGAKGDDIGSNVDQGSAYIFTTNAVVWTQDQKLVAADGAAFDEFGVSVSTSGSYAVVGAASDDIGFDSDAGSVYFYSRIGTWNFTVKRSGDSPNQYYGMSVSMTPSSAYTVVGMATEGYGLSGFVDIFTVSLGLWMPQARLTATDDELDNLFGISVFMTDDYVIVGARGDDIGTNPNQGSTYIFKKNGATWTQVKKLTNALTGTVGASFGSAVGITTTTCVVGEYYGINPNLAGARTGAAHFTTIDF